jgi:hypothetical protein
MFEIHTIGLHVLRSRLCLTRRTGAAKYGGRWENNITMDFRELVCEDSGQWWALVNTINESSNIGA